MRGEIFLDCVEMGRDTVGRRNGMTIRNGMEWGRLTFVCALFNDPIDACMHTYEIFVYVCKTTPSL